MSDDFLSRWSRRKRETESAPQELEAAPAAPEETLPEDVEGEDDAELLARLGLKHPEEMQAGDDFSQFLKAAVPRHLKTLAFRRLWRSNPTLACLDGLNDYDGDFTGTGVPPGGLKTSYQVGRGLLRRVAAAAKEMPADEEAESPPASSERAEEPPAPVASEPPPVAEAAPEPDPDGPGARATRRRMAFRAARPSGS